MLGGTAWWNDETSSAADWQRGLWQPSVVLRERRRRRDPTEDVAELKVADAIDKLRQLIEHQHESAEVSQIRSQQRTFLKANQKFPDFIDVGIDVWERMEDWHVKTRQPLTIVRTNDGRYGMTFLTTTLVLQPQQVGTYISWGYDSGETSPESELRETASASATRDRVALLRWRRGRGDDHDE